MRVGCGAMPALIFDLDGTLVDTVYAHVFAWQRALGERGMAIDGWKIHRRIGMSGGLFTRAVGRELGRELTDDEAAAIQDHHGRVFRELLPDRRALPGAAELLADLRGHDVVHGIATAGRLATPARAARDRFHARAGGRSAPAVRGRSRPAPGCRRLAGALPRLLGAASGCAGRRAQARLRWSARSPATRSR